MIELGLVLIDVSQTLNKRRVRIGCMRKPRGGEEVGVWPKQGHAHMKDISCATNAFPGSSILVSLGASKAQARSCIMDRDRRHVRVILGIVRIDTKVRPTYTGPPAYLSGRREPHSSYTMENRDVYAAVIGSLFAVFLGWQLASISHTLGRHSIQLLRKIVVQTILVTRRKGSSDYTIGAALSVLLFLSGNITALSIRLRDLHELRARLQAIFHINLIPLFLSTRTPRISQTVFGLSSKQHGLLHRILGWVCVAECLGYYLLSVFLQPWPVASYEFAVSVG